jgi:hypothetical protein
MTTWTTPPTFVAGAALTAAELNTYVRDNTTYLYDRVVGYNPTKSTDQTKTNATFATITDLTFPVANGKNYTVVAVLKWSHSTAAAGDGPGFGYDHPGGTTGFLFEYTGNGSSTGMFRDWQNATDAGIVSQNDSAGASRICIIHGTYQASASGTFSMRFKRFNAGTLTVYAGSSLFVTSD